MQRKASETHKRFVGDSFDLDMSYITDRIIAMSFPAKSFSEQKWRNRIEDVKRFFQQRHFHAHKIYNLCIEKDRAYDEDIFEEYAHWPFAEKHCPDIKDIWSFCEDAQEWLEKDALNIIALHCTHGKARTGLMIICYMLFAKIFENKNDAIEYYNFRRTTDGQGVVIPSQ